MLSRRLPLLGSFALALLGLMWVGCFREAVADDTDAIQIENSQWISVEHYGENVKKNRPTASEIVEEKKQAITDTPEPAPPVAAAETPAAPVVAAPMRPVDVPMMPAVVRNFNLQIDSTADANAEPIPPVIRQSGKLDITPEDQKWREATEMAREHADDARNKNFDGERTPVDVRWTYLPNPKIVPQERPQRAPRARIAEISSASKPKPVEAPAKNTVQECAAIDTYKKKQLEALQSDRKTLEALQSAIADLGLQKQLNFMTGAKQETNASAPQVGGSTPIPTGTP